MVTRIYTPPVMSYYRAQQINSQEEGSSGQAAAEQPITQPQQQSVPANAFSNGSVQNPQNDASQQQSRPLLASARQAQKIQMGTILQDFNSTLNALGVDENTQNEVGAYLGVVAMQAGKTNPDVGFIKQSLRTAAGTLDKYISDALQQPSNVVKDWVDALLLQPIDYHLDEQGQKMVKTNVQAKLLPKEEERVDNETPAPPETAKLSPQQLQSIKTAFQSSKAAYQNGDFDTAKTMLLNTQQQLPANSPSAVQGRIALQLGKIAQTTHQYTDAQNYYEQAIHAFEQTPNATGKLAQSYLGLAETHETLGQWPQAQHYFEQTLTVAQDLPGVGIQARNGLGNSLLQQKQPQQALGQLITAYQLAQNNLGQQTELPDVLSNLGRVYQDLNRFDKSEKAYRLALKYAKQTGNLDSYRATLGQLSNLYSQNQNTNGYEQVLSRLDSISR